jgi:L-rhamnose isomerase/sugar isomerase
MQIQRHRIDEYNPPLLKDHRRRVDFLSSEIENLENIIRKLFQFQVAIQSWALGTGGAGFGRFSVGGEPILKKRLRIWAYYTH